MTDTISAIGGASGIAADPTRIDVQAPPAERPQASEDMSQQRLIIEPVSSHRFVYKVLDSTTGEVLRQLPNEHVERMITDPSYSQGGLVKTSV